MGEVKHYCYRVQWVRQGVRVEVKAKEFSESNFAAALGEFIKQDGDPHNDRVEFIADAQGEMGTAFGIKAQEILRQSKEDR